MNKEWFIGFQPKDISKLLRNELNDKTVKKYIAAKIIYLSYHANKAEVPQQTILKLSTRWCSIYEQEQKLEHEFAYEEISSYSASNNSLYVSFINKAKLILNELSIECQEAQDITKMIDIFKYYIFSMTKEREEYQERLIKYKEIVREYD